MLVSAVQRKSTISMCIHVSPPSRTSLPASLPFQSHHQQSLLSHFPVTAHFLCSSLTCQSNNSLQVWEVTCMPDAGFIFLGSLSPAFDPGSTPSLLKFLVDIMSLTWVILPHTISHTLALVLPLQISPTASPDIPNCLTCAWLNPPFSQGSYPSFPEKGLPCTFFTWVFTTQPHTLCVCWLIFHHLEYFPGLLSMNLSEGSSSNKINPRRAGTSLI